MLYGVASVGAFESGDAIRAGVFCLLVSWHAILRVGTGVDDGSSLGLAVVIDEF